MPLSEFLRMAKGKLESGRQKQCPTDLSARGEDELVELVWENGQIMMQGHSSRPTTSPTCQNLPSKTTTRIGKFGGVESMLNDISPVVPSADLDISQDDEMVPWLSYHIDDALPQDYCSQLLPEISSVTGLTPNSTRNSFVSPEKSSSNLLNGGNYSKDSSLKARTLCSWGLPQQGHTLDPSLRSGISDIVSHNTSNVFGNSAQGRDMVNDMKIERPNNTNLLNFSTFSRPATLVKLNRTNSDAIHASVEVKEKGSSNIERPNSVHKDMDFHVSSAMCANTKSRQDVAKAPKESCLQEKIDNLTSMKNDKPLIVSNNACSTKGVPDGERIIEAMVASSSVGSGNSADRVSCEQTHNSKRKFRDLEDSECRSDDIDTESVGVKKPTSGRGGTGSKRSRAAEVHNLSERRRRDRINEKMRALQELIPNCNKADKASMLDEAIEYLKTLQLQVQIMSMGTGLCMPPMMFPPGMQHMHPAHAPHFSPMGVGIGMGMGFGMGMLDMNGGSHGHPLFPVPPMHGAYFPSPIPGPTNFPRIPGQNISPYGHAGQGIPISVPRPPVASGVGGSSASRMGHTSEVPKTSHVLNPENVMTNKDSQSMCDAEARRSVDHGSNQPKATNEVLVKPTPVQENKQATDVNGPMTVTSTTETDNRAK